MFVYKPFGVCSREIHIDIENDVIKSVNFIGGCRGNTAGVASLAQGRKISEVIEKLEGIECRNGTSCPDQLAKALKLYQNQNGGIV